VKRTLYFDESERRRFTSMISILEWWANLKCPHESTSDPFVFYTISLRAYYFTLRDFLGESAICFAIRTIKQSYDTPAIASDAYIHAFRLIYWIQRCQAVPLLFIDFLGIWVSYRQKSNHFPFPQSNGMFKSTATPLLLFSNCDIPAFCNRCVLIKLDTAPIIYSTVR
jgi:hypothetical protein